MREIKFRAWDKELSYLHETFEYISVQIDSKGTLSHPDLIIEQFIGLKDKNGKEIYEGDILRYEYEAQSEYIDWDIDNASFRAMPTGLYGDDMVDDGEVIGNIHEDAHLLNPAQ